jgi:predicted MFS family arabinose efflux permease
MAALNFSAMSPFYPEIARDLETSVPLVGQVVTVMILISAALGLVVGPVADRFGFRAPLTIGLLAVGANLIGIGISPATYWLFAFSVVGGLADAIVFGLAFAVAGTHFHGAARTRAIGWTSGSLSIAPIAGVPLLALIGDVFEWRTALVVGGVAAFLAAAYVWKSLPEQPEVTTGRFRISDIVRSYRPIFRHRPTVDAYLVNLLRGITWFSFVLYMGAFLDDRMSLQTREIGFIYMLSGIGYALGGFSTRPRLPGSLNVIAATGCFACAFLVFIMVVTSSLWIVILLLPVASFLASRCGIALATRLASLHHTGAGTVMVLSGSVLNLSAALAALIGGLLIRLGGFPAYGVVIPLFSLVAGWLAIRSDRLPASA